MYHQEATTTCDRRSTSVIINITWKGLARYARMNDYVKAALRSPSFLDDWSNFCRLYEHADSMCRVNQAGHLSNGYQT